MAFQLFTELLLSTLVPDVVSSNAVLRSCDEAAMNQGESEHEDTMKIYENL